MITIAILICGIVLGLIEKPHLTEWPPKRKNIVIVAFLVGTAIFSGIKECNSSTQQDHDTKAIDSLNGGNKALQIQIEELKKESRIEKKEYEDSLRLYGQKYVDSLRAYNKVSSDSIRAFSDKNANGIKSYSSNIVKLLAKSHLRYDSVNNTLVQTVSNLKTHQLPDVGCTLSSTMNVATRINDTIFFTPEIRNIGPVVAKNIEIHGYFITSTGKETKEYWKPVWELSLSSLAPLATWTPNKSEMFFMPSKYFDSSNCRQVILIEGWYFSDDPVPVEKRLNFAYQWDCNKREWGEAGDLKSIIECHHNKNKKWLGIP